MRGGKRQGAGKPKGTKNKLIITSYFSKKEIEDLIKFAKKEAQTKPDILKFLLEQIFGKARQPITGEDGGDIKMSISWQNNILKSPTARDNGRPTSTKQSNAG